MKKITFLFLSHGVNHGTEEAPDIEEMYVEKQVFCTEETLEETLEWVLSEAYKGEYTIYDDGQTEEQVPDQDQRISDLEEALELLLSGVTE